MFPPSVVGLCLPFLLFLIVLVLSLSCAGWLRDSVPAAVEDGLLRLCEAENSVLPSLMYAQLKLVISVNCRVDSALARCGRSRKGVFQSL